MDSILGGNSLKMPEFKPEEMLKTVLSATESKKVITDITVVMDGNAGKAKAKCPKGYTLIDADLNKGSGGQYIYLCARYEEITVMKKK